VSRATTPRLRRVSDSRPGYTRRRRGRAFAYYRPDGRRLGDRAELARIRALAIPPAWTEVWICTEPGGHIQATGRDARGRKQYRYHPRWAEARAADKYDRMVAFARALPGIRRRVRAHLALPGLPRERSLAAVVRLLDLALIRVGNSEYARDNDSFGLTTLRRRHVAVHGGRVTFRFTGKSRKPHAVEVRDARLAGVIRDCLARPGRELFKYETADGRVCDVTAADVNDYLRALAVPDVSAKDFRTWAATVIVVGELLAAGAPATQRERKSRLLAAIDIAAARLNNTRAICRRSYVHPRVSEAWLADGSLPGSRRRGGEPAARRVLSRLLRVRL
jgi:DNA topoisomerase-1